MERSLVFLAGVIVVVVAVAGVYFVLRAPVTPPPSSRLSVIASFYPIYDFAKNVAGDRANVSVLVPETLDVHEFDPTPSDLQRVSSANVLIYSGAGLEPWVPSLVAAVNKPSLTVVDTSMGITLLPVSQEFQRNNRTIDPHIWLDPIDAKKQVENIAKGLSAADPTNAQYYTSNAAAYEAKLDALNAEIVRNTTSTKTKLFITFHEAFAYYAKRYNLTQISIQGPFQEEPTPSDIQNIVNTINKYHLRYVGYESLENPAIPQAISGQTNATLILMDPIEGLTPTDKAVGLDYISLLHMDTQNIVKALDNVG